jgi:hypothetical protein
MANLLIVCTESANDTTIEAQLAYLLACLGNGAYSHATRERDLASANGAVDRDLSSAFSYMRPIQKLGINTSYYMHAGASCVSSRWAKGSKAGRSGMHPQVHRGPASESRHGSRIAMPSLVS